MWEKNRFRDSVGLYINSLIFMHLVGSLINHKEFFAMIQ